MWRGLGRSKVEPDNVTTAAEHDAAQERGEVAGHGGGRNFNLDERKVETTAADLGLRLADEYAAAQERGDVATGNRTKDFSVEEHNAKPAPAADLGLRRASGANAGRAASGRNRETDFNISARLSKGGQVGG